MAERKKRILLVDDEERLLHSISQRLAVLGFDPYTATSGLAAIEIVMKQPIDLAIVDLQMPDMNGLVTITKLKEIDPNLRTILLTGHGNDKIKQATESLNSLYFEKDKMGDFWGFIKQLNTDGNVVVIHPAPSASGAVGSSGFPALNSIEVVPRRDFSEMRFRSVSAAPTVDQPGDVSHLRMIGETVAMQELKKNLDRVAPLDSTVLLAGEDGTGKELAARIIHSQSRRRHRRFLAIDCGNLGSEPFIRQLIGYGKSDLYAAIQSQRGIFGPDRVGTLFFDRLEAMPAAMQAQLLKAIDAIDRSRVDEGQTESSDIRILAATETDLGDRVASGRFDGELYHRLSIFNLFLPPLRERKDDIPPLCSYFLRKLVDEFKKPVEFISSEVIDLFAAYDFPGNVRELAHLIERAVILADGREIKRKHLPERFFKDAPPAAGARPDSFLTLAEVENRHILDVLEATQGNKSKTAEILGISRAALWRKLKQLTSQRTPHR